eukprot:5829725-Pleurochrysis_carterae.AAC.3
MQKTSSPAARVPRSAPEPAGRIRGLAVYVWVYAPTSIGDAPVQLSRATTVVETPPLVLTMTEKATRTPAPQGIANESWSSQAPLTGTVKRMTVLKAGCACVEMSPVSVASTIEASSGRVICGDP